MPVVAPEPPGQFGEIAKGILFGSVCRVRWAAHESAGLAMKRAERIVRLKAAPVLSCGAARVLESPFQSSLSGLGVLPATDPALKRRAIIGPPFGTGGGSSLVR